MFLTTDNIENNIGGRAVDEKGKHVDVKTSNNAYQSLKCAYLGDRHA